jgi:uncharacterized hydrophobic protein (TIGR00271 family)
MADEEPSGPEGDEDERSEKDRKAEAEHRAEEVDLIRDEYEVAPEGRAPGWRGALRYLWPRRDLSREERREVLAQLFPEPAESRLWTGRHFSLMAFSVAIATYGLLNDSAAVVIGAMLIAPLMTPMMGYAAAMVMAWPRRQAWTLGVIVTSSLLGIALAAVLSGIAPSPDDQANLPAEVLARTSPNVLDLMIALAAGGAGAYVTVHTRVSGALPGVAIAVALVPPLATAGILVAFTEWTLAGGALLLFATNWAAIVFAATVVFLLSGVAPRARVVRYTRSIQFGIVFAVGVVVAVAIPLGLHTFNEIRTTNASERAAGAVDDWIGERELRVVDLDVDHERDPDEVSVTCIVAGPDRPASADALATTVADSFDREADVSVRWLREQASDATAAPGG